MQSGLQKGSDQLFFSIIHIIIYIVIILFFYKKRLYVSVRSEKKTKDRKERGL